MRIVFHGLQRSCAHYRAPMPNCGCSGLSLAERLWWFCLHSDVGLKCLGRTVWCWLECFCLQNCNLLSIARLKVCIAGLIRGYRRVGASRNFEVTWCLHIYLLEKPESTIHLHSVTAKKTRALFRFYTIYHCLFFLLGFHFPQDHFSSHLFQCSCIKVSSY